MNHREYYKSIAGATIIPVGETGGEVVCYQNNGKFISVGFEGRRSRSNYAFSFSNEIAREHHQGEWIANQIRKGQERERKRQEKKALDVREEVKIGDIFYHSYGYEQTNVNFYKVARVTSKTIFCEELSSEYVEEIGHNMSGKVKPTGEVISGSLQSFRATGRSDIDGELIFSTKYGSLGRYTKPVFSSSYH